LKTDQSRIQHARGSWSLAFERNAEQRHCRTSSKTLSKVSASPHTAIALAIDAIPLAITGPNLLQRLLLARVNAALRADARRLRVAAALRPAARRFRVNAPCCAGVSLALRLALGFAFMIFLLSE
jgi:hypothetical protein